MSKLLRGRATTFTTDQLTSEYITGRQLLAVHQFGTPDSQPIAGGVPDRGALEAPLIRTVPGPVDPRTLLVSQPGCIVGEVHKTPGQFSGNDSLLIGPNVADEGTLTVAVGGSVSGVIDVTGDVDTIEVTLVAGQTYLFSLVGSGGTPVTDTFLSIFAPGGALILEDDDGGNGLYSLITITAATSGTYTLTAESFSNPGDPGLGEWTLSVRQQGADEAPSAPPSAVLATLGENYGFISPAGTDEDVYQITLTAGMIYDFQVAGGADYNTDFLTVPLGELDTIIRVYDSAGTLLFTNDDVDFPDDISSAIGFIPETSGIYYVEVDAYSGQTGGYVLNITETDISTLDPLDSIDWGTQVATSNITVYFAAAGEVFDGVTSLGWNAYETQQAMAALATYSQFANLTFSIAAAAAGSTFQLVTTNSSSFLGYFNPPGETNAGVGVFARNGTGWDEGDTNGGLEVGGYGWITMIHEFGHGLGLAHPHDNGGTSEVMAGVTGPFGSYGIFDMNQGVYTTMSYNDGWQLHPDADGGFPDPDTLDYGYQGTPMALDMALIQLKYGSVSANTGNSVYTLGTANLAGTYYQAIWDTGGTDEIVYVGSDDATIDLIAATLDYSATGGGALSWVDGIFGGYTIANGVVIENATGGDGDDNLLGNAAANILTGNDGNDTFVGREGDDEIHGDGGTDTLVLSGNQADYTVTAIAGGHTVEDNLPGDGDDGLDTVYDLEFLQFADGTVNLGDAPGNQAPTLTGFGPSVAFDEQAVNGSPQLIDSDVVFEDSDGNFDGGTIVVSGLLAEDVVAVRNEGSGAGQVGVSGANITYGGVTVGTVAGGNGTTLTITLNAQATSIAVDQIIENLTYANASNSPTANRTLTINVTDDEGADLASSIFVPGPYVELTGANDPFANPGILPTFGNGPNFAFVDVNNDGDLDIVVGDQAGTLRYFEKNGAAYTEVIGAANPFNGFDPGSYTTPALMDVDGDSDQDLVVGSNAGIFSTFRNNGNGTWTALAGAANPFNGLTDPNFSDPAAIDVDGDGDIDMISGSSYGDMYAFLNNGSGVFTMHGIGDPLNPFGAVDVGTFSSPATGDVDGDGDLDVIIGIGSGATGGQIRTFINNGAGSFTEVTGVNNPFNGIDVGSYALPTLADIDGDGDADLVVGDSAGGDTRVWQNTSTTTPGAAPTIQIIVNAQNDAPSGTNGSATIVENSSHTFDAGDFGFSDPLEGDDFAGVLITTLPGQGTLLLNGVAVTAGQFVTAADIAGGLLTYEPDPDENGANYASFTFQVRDDGGTLNSGVDTDPTPNTFSFAVTPDNTAPTLTDVDSPVTFLENTVNATPQILDADVDFQDAEGNFNGGSLTVTGMLPEDFIGVNDEGAGPGQIGVSGLNVTYGGVIIGTITDAVGLFTVDLNSAATSAAVDALIQNLTYSNNSDTPTASRTLTIDVFDDEGLHLLQSGFDELTGANNPFAAATSSGNGSIPTFVDADDDGDLDLVVGGQDGVLDFYRNDGGGVYTHQTGANNPFDGFDVGASGSYSAPAAIDVDNDGDMDLVVGSNYGDLVVLESDGNGGWTDGGFLSGVIVSAFSTPTAVDLDGDGLDDLVLGNSYGFLYGFINNGDGSFTELIGANDPFLTVSVPYFSAPGFVDIDGDGDMDAVVGDYYGGLTVFTNDGGTFSEAATSPFDGFTFSSVPAFTFVDLDNDGDLDGVAGSIDGDIRTFENLFSSGVQIVVNVTPENDVPLAVELYDGADVLVATYATIQEAVDAASNGYRIFAGAGTYTENVTVDVDVTIQGANVGVAGTGTRVAESIIDGQVTVSADGVTIDGVRIVGDAAGPLGTTGIVVGAGSDNFSIVNSVLDGNGDFAFFVNPVTGLNVATNLIQGYSIGFYITGGTTAGSIHDNLFQGDSGPLTGLGNGVNSETSLVLIQNNIFDGLYSGVLNLFPFGPNPVDLDTYVIGNTLTDNAAARPVQVYPTADSTDIIGTDYNEAFNGDIAGLASGTALSFHGQGGDDHIYGFDAGDTLSGGTGQDRIFAQAGDDTLNGGAAHDLLDGGTGIDTALFADNFVTYTDSVVGWVIGSSEGNDILQNVEAVEDGSSRRTLLVGATGFAALQDALDEAETGNHVRLASGVHSGTVTYYDSGLVVIGQPGSQQNVTYDNDVSGVGITIFGADLADTITTDDGNDLVFGRGGADTLSTGDGDDTLSGGAGDDNMSGGGGNDIYHVGEAGDVVNEAVGEGSDIIYSAVSYALNDGSEVEALATISFTAITPIDLTGNGLNNYLIGNDGGNVLNGAGGADVMVGRAGGDIYLVDNAGDAVFEDVGGGYDVIYTSVSYTLTNDQEIEGLSTITWENSDAIDLTGNASANYLIGNAGENELDGKDGNDVLQGKEGADDFAFTTALGANNIDTIFDFNFAGTEDTIVLSQQVFTELDGGVLDSNAFALKSAPGEADDRIIYDNVTGELFYDEDGSGTDHSAILFAVVQNAPALNAGDFFISI